MSALSALQIRKTHIYPPLGTAFKPHFDPLCCYSLINTEHWVRLWYFPRIWSDCFTRKRARARNWVWNFDEKYFLPSRLEIFVVVVRTRSSTPFTHRQDQVNRCLEQFSVHSFPCAIIAAYMQTHVQHELLQLCNVCVCSKWRTFYEPFTTMEVSSSA